MIEFHLGGVHQVGIFFSHHRTNSSANIVCVSEKKNIVVSSLLFSGNGKLSLDSLGTVDLNHNSSPYHAFFIRYLVSNKWFMVDTGLSCSIWP